MFSPIYICPMPAVNQQKGPPAQRTTFRPPWVKESADPPQPSGAPWRRQSRDEPSPSAPVVAPKEEPKKPQNSAAKKTSTAKPTASGRNSAPEEPVPAPPPGRKQSKITIIPSKPAPPAAPQPKENGAVAPRTPPPMPAAPPMPPPPPPQPKAEKKKHVAPEKVVKLDALKRTPRKRPDWGQMMKEVEAGIRLRHIECNDRSKPLLPKVKAKGQFVYESERANLHSKLLTEIQTGVSLKRVKCNDRSKPLLEGLKKFRRQLTIEEQIQKAEEEEVVEPDELDDIDKVRDDLQSTKQMLALELKNKENVEKENRNLQIKILTMEEELEKLKKNQKNIEKVQIELANRGLSKSSSRLAQQDGKLEKQRSKANMKEKDLVEEEINSLRGQAELARKTADEYENKYKNASQELVKTRATLEDTIHKNMVLEKRIKHLQEKKGAPAMETVNTQTDGGVIVKQPSRKQINKKQESISQDEEEEEETEEETESESDEEVDAEAVKAKRMERELKMLLSKMKTLDDKEMAARNERKALKEQMNKLQKTLKDERKKQKELQKEVDKMANLLKDIDEEEEEEEKDDDEEEDDEEEESEESEEEESEESETESEEDNASEPHEKRIRKLQDRVKSHENTLNALKKGNYLLKANIDRLKDDLEKQKESYVALQEDLNSVLAELG